MKQIDLTQGLSTFVDDEDFEYLSQWKWCISYYGQYFYATRRSPSGGKIYMHRCILDVPPGMVCNHINGNTLDNTRSNLRLCTLSQKSANSKIKTGASGFRGVWGHHSGKWVAHITIDRKRICIGMFDDAASAAVAYDHYALMGYGEFARTNFSYA